MFDGLKKKFSNFIHSVAKKEEQVIVDKEADSVLQESTQTKEESNTKQEIKENASEQLHPTALSEASGTSIPSKLTDEEKHSLKKELSFSEQNVVKDSSVNDVSEKETYKIFAHETEKIKSNTQQKTTQTEDTVHKNKTELIHPVSELKPPKQTLDKKIENVNVTDVPSNPSMGNSSKYISPTPVQSEKPHLKTEKTDQPKVSFGTKLKGVFLKEISVKEADIEPFLEDLKISLLQSDVNYDATERILANIKKGLLERKITSKQIDLQISNVLKESILEILGKSAKLDLVSMAREKRTSGEPLKILFIGPNGAGKTTTMAKLANMFIKNGFTAVLSASDTFRAAAIEQTSIHAQRLGIGVIKGRYGADPASVAFDAIAHAKAHHINVVLIDSAGRQETNKSLMEEVKKIVRITTPDIKIFVGESITGNSLLSQVNEFNEAVKLDGVILTKLDCDAKGGNTLSILSETNVPVLFFGTGEGYDDLMPYSPTFIIENMVAS